MNGSNPERKCDNQPTPPANKSRAGFVMSAVSWIGGILSKAFIWLKTHAWPGMKGALRSFGKILAAGACHAAKYVAGLFRKKPKQKSARYYEEEYEPTEQMAPRKSRAVILAVDALLLLAFAASALFCYVSLTAEDERLSVTLNMDGKSVNYQVWPTTVGAFLRANGIVLFEADEVSCPLDAKLKEGMKISIVRAFPVAVESGGGVTLVKLTKGTVGRALELAKIDYDVSDEISRLPFEDVTPGMRIRHTDVDVDYKTVYETLEYNEETIKDDTMYKGQSKIVTSGEDGQKQITRRITTKNGREFSREIVDQVVIKEAINEVIRVGTKIRYQTSYAGEWREYKEPPVAGKDGWIEMKMDYITAYSTGKRTARGTVPNLGTIAVNPYYIPYYSQIYVKNYGYGTALDTGAFRNRLNDDGTRVNQLDLFFNTEAECRRWGRKRNVTVLVKLRK